MNCFVDTSAFYAVLASDDDNHVRASQQWKELLGGSAALLTTNYVLVETCALLQQRIGIEAVRVFQEAVLPVVNVEWVDQAMHAAAAAVLVTAGCEKLSLVDCVSFNVMRRLGIDTAFAFDKHFKEQGFVSLP